MKPDLLNKVLPVAERCELVEIRWADLEATEGRRLDDTLPFA